MMIAAYRATLRLAFRSIWLWAVTLPILVLAWLFTNYCVGPGCVSNFFHQPFFAPFFLGQLLASVAHAQTERWQHADELLEALPYRSAATVVGRAGAIFTVWLGAGTLVYLLTAGRTVVAHGLPLTAFLFWDWFLVIPLTLIFTTGMGYGIGSLGQKGFGAYLAVLLLFLSGTFPFNQVVSSLFMGLFGAGPLATLDFTLSSYFPLTQIPIFPDLWPLVFNRLFAVSLGVGALAAVVWTGARRRREGGTRRAALAGVAAVLALMIALGGARGVWAERVAQMQIEWGSTSATQPEVTSGIPAPTIGAYDLKITFTPERHGLRAEAKVDVKATGDVAALTLNRLFRVGEVQGPDGKPVPFARSGDLLLITAGGRPGSYTVKYEGEVWQWRPDSWNGLRLAAHVAPESILLPIGLGWYPLPGHQTLTYLAHAPGVADAGTWHPAAPIRLEVTGAGGLSVASNALEGRPVSSAWLIGTPWTPTEAGGVRFYTSPSSRNGQQRFAEYFGPEVAWFQQLVPLEQSPVWVEVPASLWAVSSVFEVTGFPGAIIAPAAELMRLDNMRVQNWLTSVWWNTARTEEETHVYDVLKYFMLELFEREIHHRDMVPLLQQRPGGQVGTKTEQGQSLLSDLRAFHQQHGLKETGRLLTGLHRSPAPLTFGEAARAARGERP